MYLFISLTASYLQSFLQPLLATPAGQMIKRLFLVIFLRSPPCHTQATSQMYSMYLLYI